MAMRGAHCEESWAEPLRTSNNLTQFAPHGNARRHGAHERSARIMQPSARVESFMYAFSPATGLTIAIASRILMTMRSVIISHVCHH